MRIRTLSALAAALVAGCAPQAAPRTAAPDASVDPSVARSHQGEPPKRPEARSADPSTPPRRAPGVPAGPKPTMDVPNGWFQLPGGSDILGDQFEAGLAHRDRNALVLINAEASSGSPAAELIVKLQVSSCVDDVACGPVQRLPDGSAWFPVRKRDGEWSGRVGARDLCGDGKCAVQLYGQWPPEHEVASGLDFELMLGSLRMER